MAMNLTDQGGHERSHYFPPQKLNCCAWAKRTKASATQLIVGNLEGVREVLGAQVVVDQVLIDDELAFLRMTVGEFDETAVIIQQVLVVAGIVLAFRAR